MRIPTFAALLLIAASICTAQAGEKAQEIQKLLVAMGSIKTFEATFNAMLPQMRLMLKQSFGQALEKDKGEKPENIDAAVEVFINEYRKQFNIQQMVERLVVPMYDEHFSAEEVHQVRLFYESEVGQKLIKALPEITLQLATGSDTLARETIGRMMADTQFRGKIDATLRGEATK